MPTNPPAPIVAAFGEVEVAIRPATAAPSPRVAPPPPWPERWDDVDGWRRCYREARFVEPKRGVVAAWAAAAGGRMDGATVLLPPGLALAELRGAADRVGLVVGVCPGDEAL
jgi:hypothetical protein